MSYKVQGRVKLVPVHHNEFPLINVEINCYKWKQTLEQPTWFDFNFDTNHTHENLVVEFLNKQDSDTIPEQNLDKAVIVESVEFFGIQDPCFVWAGIYQPIYPEPWASQQSKLEPLLKSHNYLGWNGKWTLTFDVPVFTWIHRIQNLGWIYS